MPIKPIKHIASKTVYKSFWMALRVDDIELGDGAKSEYGVVEKANFVLVIPLKEERLMLVKQYRYPIDQWTWEFPQGGCEVDETIQEAARREIEEETGYTIKEAEVLEYLFEAASFAIHQFYVVIAEVMDKR